MTDHFVTVGDDLALPLGVKVLPPHLPVSGVPAAMVGLGAVNNTPDSAKPVSGPQQTALDLKVDKASVALNVKDYGAKGDGVTDDSAAVLAAITAAAGRAVVLENKTYLINTLILPAGVTLFGAGTGKTVLKGRLIIGGTNVLSDFTVDGQGTLASGFLGGATGSRVDRVQFRNGSASANFYLNDSLATDHQFNDCVFSDNTAGGNGVQIIDKGTAAKHYENIIFRRCVFRNNNRMNFECIQRHDTGATVVLGYRNISHYGCRFEAPALAGNTININVSYDSEMLTDNSARSSGYSVVKDSEIIGGAFGLELAGAIHMRVENNFIHDTTSFLLSMSQVGSNPAYCQFRGNRFTGTVADASIVFSGTFNLIEANYTSTPGTVRFAGAGDSQITGNYFDGLGTTTISLESAYRLTFVGNTILKGTNQTVLNIYPASINNAFIGNFVSQVNVLWDTRDGTRLHLHGNMLMRAGSHFMIESEFETIAALPAATGAYRGKTFIVQGATGSQDVLYLCVKKADETYAWVQFNNQTDAVVTSPNGTRFRLSVADDGALTTTSL